MTTSTTATFTRILVPTDFSPFSEAAASTAMALAASYGAQVRLLHVVTPFPMVAPLADLPVDSRVYDSLEDQTREWLQTEARRVRHPGIELDVEFREGAPVHEILAAADEWHADLIVVGTHGRGGFERLVLGSVAEKVLRKATCAVLAVPHDAIATARAGAVRVTHILCAHDGSPASTAGVAYAVSLAEKTGAKLTLMSVVEAPPFGDDFSGVDYTAFRAAREQHAREALDSAVGADVRVRCNVHDRIVYGHPAQQVLAVAAQERPDLLVMGVQGRGALDLLMFGSTTNHVVRHAGCPVLTVRPAATGA